MNTVKVYEDTSTTEDWLVECSDGLLAPMGPAFEILEFVYESAITNSYASGDYDRYKGKLLFEIDSDGNKVDPGAAVTKAPVAIYAHKTREDTSVVVQADGSYAPLSHYIVQRRPDIVQRLCAENSYGWYNRDERSRYLGPMRGYIDSRGNYHAL